MTKRIVDGVTYNTATSTLIGRAEGDSDDERGRSYEWTEDLLQTRGGAFWTLNTRLTEREGGEEPRETIAVERLTRAQAEKWIVTGEVEVFNNPFGDPPEAEEEPDPSATVYFRMPASLKSGIEQAAKRANLSVNAWLMRCAEGCVQADRLKVAE